MPGTRAASTAGPDSRTRATSTAWTSDQTRRFAATATGVWAICGRCRRRRRAAPWPAAGPAGTRRGRDAGPGPTRVEVEDARVDRLPPSRNVTGCAAAESGQAHLQDEG